MTNTIPHDGCVRCREVEYYDIHLGNFNMQRCANYITDMLYIYQIYFLILTSCIIFDSICFLSLPLHLHWPKMCAFCFSFWSSENKFDQSLTLMQLVNCSLLSFSFVLNVLVSHWACQGNLVHLQILDILKTLLLPHAIVTLAWWNVSWGFPPLST